jgi:phosphatidylserine decarboxylase
VDVALNIRYRGPNELPCHATYEKGEEMGWFEHGSTILVFAPPGIALCEGLASGQQVRMGEALLNTNDPAEKTQRSAAIGTTATTH